MTNFYIHKNKLNTTTCTTKACFTHDWCIDIRICCIYYLFHTTQENLWTLLTKKNTTNIES